MITLEGLRVRAGEFELAIDDLSVGRAEYLMILGPTASGKTVLLETLAGLRRSQTGRIWFGEMDVTDRPPERRRVGLVYQDYALFPHLTVAGNIGFGLRAADKVAHIRELAHLVGVDGLLDRYPEGLSGGERQRVALARALATEPEVLLLDEPLGALDGPTRLELQRLLKRVHQATGATVMHVTHDLDEALALGDRVAVLINGELRQVGDPRHVTRRPVDVEVARLSGMKNIYPLDATSTADGDSQAGDGPRDDYRGGRPRPCPRVRLDDGREILADDIAATGGSGPLCALVRADEIRLEVLGPTSAACVNMSAERNESRARDRANGDNVLEGIVRAVSIQSVHASIEVEVPPDRAGRAPLTLTVHVLSLQVEEMDVRVGGPVRLRFPPSAVHVCRGTVSEPPA